MQPVSVFNPTHTCGSPKHHVGMLLFWLTVVAHSPNLYASAGTTPARVATTAATPATAAAATPATTTTPTKVDPNRPMTAQQYIQQQYQLRQEIKKMQQQVDQIAEAHQNALAQNQSLQMANDNLSVQVKVLQSEQSAQMFLYGAATIVIGAIIGFMLGNVVSRRQRRW